MHTMTIVTVVTTLSCEIPGIFRQRKATFYPTVFTVQSSIQYIHKFTTESFVTQNIV